MERLGHCICVNCALEHIVPDLRKKCKRQQNNRMIEVKVCMDSSASTGSTASAVRHVHSSAPSSMMSSPSSSQGCRETGVDGTRGLVFHAGHHERKHQDMAEDATNTFEKESAASAQVRRALKDAQSQAVADAVAVHECK